MQQLVNYNGQLINLNGGVLANKFPIRDGLVFYLDPGVDKCYPDTGTTATDLSVSSHDISLINGVVFDENNKGHFSFDGTNSYLTSISSIDLSHTNKITFIMWYRHLEILQAEYAAMIFELSNLLNSNIGSFAVGNDFWIGGQYIQFAKKTPTSYHISRLNSFQNDDVWHMFAITFDSDQTTASECATYFVDSIQENSSLHGALFDISDANFSSYNAYIGSRAGSSYFDDGRIGLIQIYDRVLSQDEIRSIYNHHKQRFEHIITDGLVLNLDAQSKFSYPGTGTTWSDLAPSGNDATLVNGPTYQSEPAAIVFDGVNDYANLPDFTLSGDSTVELVFNLDSAAGNDTRILGTSVGGSQTNQLAAKIDNDTDFYLWCRLSANAPFSSYGWAQMATISPDEPIFVSFVNDTTTSTVRSYVNGVLDSSKSYQFEFTKMSIGSPFTGLYGSYFRGDIHEVRMYDKVLTADEIAYNFEARRGRYGI